MGLKELNIKSEYESFIDDVCQGFLCSSVE